ncbi:MAG: hypothetical protein AABY16_03870 [Nanoarchaeota archaeon]
MVKIFDNWRRISLKISGKFSTAETFLHLKASVYSNSTSSPTLANGGRIRI